MNFNGELKFVLIVFLSLIALYKILIISLPIIIDYYFWSVVSTSTPTPMPYVRSLKVVFKVQKYLYTLENELLILNSKEHPNILNFENYWDPKLSAIELKIREVNEYSKKLGPLDPAEKARVSCIETVKILDGISKSFDQAKDEAFRQLYVYATKVRDLLLLLPKWEIHKHVEYLTEINIVLYKRQRESHMTTDNNSLKESIVLMKTLVQHFESIDEVTEDILQILIANLTLPNSSKYFEKNQSGNTIPSKIHELQVLKNGVVRFHKENLYKFGEVYLEILSAVERIPKLFTKRMENVRHHWSSLENQLLAKINSIRKLQLETAKMYNCNDNMEKAQGFYTHKEL